VYILVSFGMSVVKLAALCTIRQQRWLTRDVRVSVKTRQVVRTLQPAAEPEKVTA
jgi:hyaluronan synthase